MQAPSTDDIALPHHAVDLAHASRILCGRPVGAVIARDGRQLAINAAQLYGDTPWPETPRG